MRCCSHAGEAAVGSHWRGGGLEDTTGLPEQQHQRGTKEALPIVKARLKRFKASLSASRQLDVVCFYKKRGEHVPSSPRTSIQVIMRLLPSFKLKYRIKRQTNCSWGDRAFPAFACIVGSLMVPDSDGSWSIIMADAAIPSSGANHFIMYFSTSPGQLFGHWVRG